jgi:putative ATP-dependent endonuclease of OLD family
MKMRQLRIHNYRSIKDLTIQVPDMLVLVGPNNSGKSNILRAIEFGLSASAKPNPEDFFSFRSEDELWVEMTFDRLTEQEESTFREYLSDDKTIRIQKNR